MLVFLISASAASFLLLIYPYAVYPLILRCLPKRPYASDSLAASARPSAALLFCAYNEEQSMPAKIANIREIKLRLPDLEVHAYTDCCTDGTVSLLRDAADVVTLHEGKQRAGKATGMRQLVASTNAEIVVFTDANVILDADAISRAVAYFANPEIGTVAGTLHYSNPDESYTAWTGSLYWRLEESIKHLESETGSTMGSDGAFYATRRKIYPDVPPNLLDDMIVSISPLFSGSRVISVPDVHAYERATTKSRDEFRRKRRIACRAFNTHKFLRPKLRQMRMLDRFKYFSHKYLRWFSAAFLLLTGLFATAAIWINSGAVIALSSALVALSVLALGYRLKLPVLDPVAEIMLSMMAVGIGIAESIAGKDYQTWNPPASR